jgi:hypothetical protein
MNEFARGLVDEGDAGQPPVVTIVGVVIVVAPMNATGTPPIRLITHGLSSGSPVASLITLASTTGKSNVSNVIDGPTCSVWRGRRPRRARPCTGRFT